MTVVLYGEAPGGKPTESPAFKLETSINNFERGQVDTFEVEATVGTLKKIKIGGRRSSLYPQCLG